MSVYEFGPFQLDAERLLLLDERAPIALGPKVVETLLALVEHPGDVLTKSALLDRIWPEGYVDEANLAQNVYVLRKTLRAAADSRRSKRFRDADTASSPRFGGSTSTLANPRRRFKPSRRRYVGKSGWRLRSRLSRDRRIGVPGAPERRTPAHVRRSAALSNRALLLESAHARRHREEHGVFRSRDRHRPARRARLRRACIGRRDHGRLPIRPVPPRVYFARAREYAHKALEIDPKYGEAYAVLGMLSSERTRFDKQMNARRAAPSDRAGSVERPGARVVRHRALRTRAFRKRTRNCASPPSSIRFRSQRRHGSETRRISNATTTMRSITPTKRSISRRSASKFTERSAWRTKRAATTSARLRRSRIYRRPIRTRAPRRGTAWPKFTRNRIAWPRRARTRVCARARRRRRCRRSGDCDGRRRAATSCAVVAAAPALRAYLRAEIASDPALQHAAQRSATRRITKARVSRRATRGRSVGVVACAPGACAHARAARRRARQRFGSAPHQRTRRADGCLAQRLRKLRARSQRNRVGTRRRRCRARSARAISPAVRALRRPSAPRSRRRLP